MSFLSSSNNAILVDSCQNLQNLTVTLNVTEDMVTVGNTGFSVQLNSYPQPGSTSQNQSINWFQYIIYVGGPLNNQLGWEIQVLGRRGDELCTRPTLAARIYTKSSQHDAMAAGTIQGLSGPVVRPCAVEPDSGWLGHANSAHD